MLMINYCLFFFQSSEVLSSLSAVNVINPEHHQMIPGPSSSSTVAAQSVVHATGISDISELQIVTTPHVVEEIYETTAAHEATTENYVDVEVKDGQRIRLKVPANIDPAAYGREYLQSMERQEQVHEMGPEENP